MPQQPLPRNSSYGQARRLTMAQAKEYALVDSFKHGYRNREEITMLPPGVLVVGSQNVMTGTNGRVGIVKGYSHDGSSSIVLAPISCGVTWRTSKGYERNVRAGFLTTAGNDGKLQFRYEDANGNIIWKDLLTGLTSADFNFTDFWDANTEQIAMLLGVNGSSNIYEWSGAEAVYASSGTDSITIGNAETIAELGFYTQNTRKVTINGTEYTYTGGETTHTFTGVTPSPASSVFAVGDLVFQTIRATPATSIASLGLSTVSVIGTVDNQVYYGELTNNNVYISKANNYKDCGFTGAGRLPDEGGLLNLGTPVVGFAPQESQMYISAGLDQWYLVEFKMSSDLTKEDVSVGPLKTGARQSAQSQRFITKDKNNIVYLSNEPTISTLGRVQNILQTPQITDISFPIINDMNSYDFTGGSTYYWKNFILVAIPKHSIVRIYNMTDAKDHYWEVPIQYPVTGFYEVNGELYGHGYLTSESYKLFDGFNFIGNPIDARAIFSYQNLGVRTQTKKMNAYYIEGRCTQNGVLKIGINYETDGAMSETEYSLDGSDSEFVAIPGGQNALGKYPIGKQPLGSNIGDDSTDPPKFRKIITFPPTSHYEFQPKFSSVEKDFNWSMIAFGGNESLTTEGNNNIKS